MTLDARCPTGPVLPDVAPRPAWPLTPARRARASVQRAIAEVLAGRPVAIDVPGGAPRIVLPVDAIEPGALAALRALAHLPPVLAVSRTRAAALGLPADGGVALRLGPDDDDARALELAAGRAPAAIPPAVPLDAAGEAAVELAKLSLLLPAAIVAPLADAASAADLVLAAADDVLAFRSGHAGTLRLVSSAPVPLRAASDCELRVFRDELGQSWSMIVVGCPDTSRPVPVRLHSACLTGDAFGSLRCDCGDQLQMAIGAIDALGGGALLYLAQEGCGLGLANKMRAYRLQELGLDTVDANTALGFEVDERRYDAAARMLRAAGIGRVALLTNNPSKLSALRAAGLDVVERIPLLAPVRRGNRRYLDAKRRRAGHLIAESAFGSAG